MIVTLIVFAPTLDKLTTHELTTDVDDGLDFRWKIWWVRHAVVDRHQIPYRTDLLWYPTGTPLWLDALNSINGLQAIALAPLLGESLTFNFLVLESFVLSGAFFYLLMRTYVSNRLAAFLGGLLFALAPFRFAHMYGHLNFVTTQFVPLAVWTVRRGLQSRERRWPIAAGAALLLTFLSDVLFLGFTVLITLGTIAMSAPASFKTAMSFHRHAIFLIRYVFCAAVFVAPLVGAMVYEFLGNDYSPGHDAGVYCADLLMYAGPGESSMWSGMTRINWSHFTGNIAENAGGFGVVCLCACGYAWMKRRSVAWPWLLGAFVAVVISLGPELHIHGRYTGISMPYGWLEKLFPAIGIAGTPVRFCFLAMFCANVAAGIGIDAWLARLSSKPAHLWGYVFITIVVVEFWPASIPCTKVELAPAERTVLTALREEPGDFAVLTAPTHDNLTHKSLQVLHWRKLVGGWVSRFRVRPMWEIQKSQLLSVLYGLHDPIPSFDYRAAMHELTDKNIRHVIAVSPKLRTFVRGLGLKERFDGEHFAIFDVR